ncbi:hypothetical protein DDB_G0291364 [Dictyostelium discoideum AX4]|uniref:Uncharacterized transmembrane protein DDB_G0291364 n=1 Tax=Dictyostelium discoideum TaxID=44689 RepID=Y3845_DICDI|nr:hypothetical protein DDB_G0291364 [Dictyostelium discoideum AX4]Q54ES5.1 RecName: Full=Uncharacterized transmembrane protein DDB_G0291364; Flags: Precursor [Dictyostelium discoideum]EAL61666.1 hypothetical protein DDB_G0291364 [Dictyostelium discoideum AX4]|eukprot:XP_635165.1 hypothetical protein DDB_G0291364 [Dictyostelium discoideum AX4]
MKLFQLLLLVLTISSFIISNNGLVESHQGRMHRGSGERHHRAGGNQQQPQPPSEQQVESSYNSNDDGSSNSWWSATSWYGAGTTSWYSGGTTSNPVGTTTWYSGGTTSNPVGTTSWYSGGFGTYDSDSSSFSYENSSNETIVIYINPVTLVFTLVLLLTFIVLTITQSLRKY